MGANAETLILEVPVSPRSAHEDAGLTKSLLALSSLASPVEGDHDSFAWVPDGVSSPASFRSYKTSFAPEVVEHLERTNPGVLMWLGSTSGMLFQGILIIFYVVVETISGLLISFSLKPDPPPKFKPVPSSIIVMKSGLSIIIGLFITVVNSMCYDKTPLARAIPRTFGAVCQWRNILSYALIAALLCISDVFTMLTYSKLDAGLKKILDQLRLPITAAMSTAIVRKRYSMHEWLALFVVLLAICSFYIANVEHDETTQLHQTCRYPPNCFNEPSYDICARRVDGSTMIGAAIQDKKNVNGTWHDIRTFAVKASKSDFQGFVFSLLATLFNCAGSLFFEKLVKSTASTPFPTQKVQMETTGLPVAMAMSFLVPLYIDNKGGKAIWWSSNEAEGSGGGFFQGYNELTWIVIALGIMQAWMSGIIVKQFSALVKQFSKCFILLLTVICTGTMYKACHEDPLPMTMYSLAFIIAAATVLFASMPK